MRSIGPRGAHVAHIIQYFSIGGLERMVLSMVREHRKLGITSTVLAYLGDGELRAAFEEAGAHTISLEHAHEHWSPTLSYHMARALEGRGIDLVHSHHLGPFIYGAGAATLLSVPHVHTEHSHEFFDAQRRRMLGAHMHRLARLTCVTQEISDWRQRQWGVPSEVIPNGVELPDPGSFLDQGLRARRALGLSSMSLIVGCVARLAPEKGHDTLLRAFALLRASIGSSVELVLVGDGPERGKLEALAQDLGLGDSVHFTGFRQDVDALYPMFDVVALTSHREGLPLALLEAMGHAKPVVATAVGGVTGLLEDGGGRLVPDGDVTAVAEALEVYSRDHALRRCDGLRGRCIIKYHYSSEVMATRYAQIYGSTLRRVVRGAS